jgi:hypothetical protein
MLNRCGPLTLLMSALGMSRSAPLDAANVKGLAVRAVEAEAPMFVDDLAVTYTCQQCVSKPSPHKYPRCHLHLSAMR